MPQGPTTGASYAQRIIAKLDILEEYRSAGVEFVGDTRPSGWADCWARNRDHGDAPSAGVNVHTGYYKDHGGVDGESLRFFDFMAAYSRNPAFKDWREARAYFAKKVGLGRKGPRKPENDKRFDDSFEFVPWNWLLVRAVVKRYPTFTEQALRECGFNLCRWPVTSPMSSYLIAAGCHGPLLTEEPPRGYSCYPVNGDKISIFKGDGRPPELRKTMNRGESGLIGRLGLEVLHDAELIIKVEGLSDLVSLQAIIPESHKHRIACITNAAGAHEHKLLSEVAPAFVGKRVIVIPDSDKPGLDAVFKWQNAIGDLAESVSAIVLDETIDEKKGRDLRDWISEGGTFDKLMLLADKAESAQNVLSKHDGKLLGSSTSVTVPDCPFDGQPSGETPTGESHHPSPVSRPETDYQAALKRLEVIILGYLEDTDTIVGFSQRTGRTFQIRNIDRYKYETALLHMGEHIESHFNWGSEFDPSKITFGMLKKAIAVEGGKRRLVDDNYLGVGVWELCGRLILVGSGEVAIINGDFTRSSVPELDGKLLDFGGSESWFDFDEIRELYSLAADPKWRQSVVEEVADVFSRWDNWYYKDTPELLAALVCCTWIQTTLPWRPQIAITGPTNSGKSTLFEETLQHLFGGPDGLSMLCSKPTEAGLRNTVGQTAKVILIDEFEHDKHRQLILSALRTSGRGGAGGILRSNTAQGSVRSKYRHIPWFCAIETGMKHAADRNRYILIEMKPVQKGKGSTLKVPEPSKLRLLGQKLLAVSLRCRSAAVAMCEPLKAETFGGIDRRIVESYSVPCAILGAVLGLDLEGTKRLMGNVLDARDFSDQSEGDEDELLRDIYESSVRLPGGVSVNVSDLIEMRSMDNPGAKTSPDEELRKVGVHKYLDARKGVEMVFFSPSLIKRHLLQGSDFKDMQINQILIRVPGAHKSRPRYEGYRPNGIAIPRAVIDAAISGAPKEDAQRVNGTIFDDDE